MYPEPLHDLAVSYRFTFFAKQCTYRNAVRLDHDTRTQKKHYWEGVGGTYSPPSNLTSPAYIWY